MEVIGDRYQIASMQTFNVQETQSNVQSIANIQQPINLQSVPIMSQQNCCICIEEAKFYFQLLCQEMEQLSLLELQEQNFREQFDIIVGTVNQKIHCLKEVAHELERELRNKIEEFVERMISSWESGCFEISRKFENVTLVSFTSPETTLSALVESVNYFIESLQYYHLNFAMHSNCMISASELKRQTTTLILRLSSCNHTLQRIMSYQMEIPFLQTINALIEKFINCEDIFSLPREHISPSEASNINASRDTNIEVIPQKKLRVSVVTLDKEYANSENHKLSSLNFVIKLLTGELLGHETDDNQVIVTDILEEATATQQQQTCQDTASVQPETVQFKENMQAFNVNQYAASTSDYQYELTNRLNQTVPMVLYLPTSYVQLNSSAFGNAYQNANEISMISSENYGLEHLQSSEDVEGRTSRYNARRNSGRKRKARTKYTSRQEEQVDKAMKVSENEVDDLLPIKIPCLQGGLFEPLA